MAMKLALFVFLMVAAPAVPISGAQRIGYLIEIHGILYCPGNSNTYASGTNIVAFARKLAQVNLFGFKGSKRTHIAEIHVVCDGKVIDYAYTDGDGGFLFAVDNERYTIPEILKTCKLVVISALTTCPKPSPSAGHLESNLKYIGDTTVGRNPKISNIVPVGFHIVP